MEREEEVRALIPAQVIDDGWSDEGRRREKERRWVQTEAERNKGKKNFLNIARYPNVVLFRSS